MNAYRIPRCAALSLVLLFSICQALVGQNWIQTEAPVTNWTSLACAADGAQVAGAVAWGGIYRSVDHGQTWVLTPAPIRNWAALASSADGTTLAAAARGDTVYVSTNSGSSWTPATGITADWSSIACSADGRRLIAGETNSVAPGYGLIHSSTNHGTTWSATAAPMFAWVSVCSSSDGSRLAGFALEFQKVTAKIFVSSDGGESWYCVTDDDVWFFLNRPVCISSSADGRTLLAGTYWEVGVSTNSGGAWTVRRLHAAYSSSFAKVVSVAQSADGRKLVAAANAQWGVIHISTNCGLSWFSAEDLRQLWGAVASSADGCALFAAVSGGGIYTSQTTPRPALIGRQMGGDLALSWLTPSTGFAPQQSSSLAQPDWTDVEAQPALNYTNLHQEVNLPAPNGPMFYRLVSRLRIGAKRQPGYAETGGHFFGG